MRAVKNFILSLLIALFIGFQGTRIDAFGKSINLNTWAQDTEEREVLGFSGNLLGDSKAYVDATFIRPPVPVEVNMFGNSMPMFALYPTVRAFVVNQLGLDPQKIVTEPTLDSSIVIGLKINIVAKKKQIRIEFEQIPFRKLVKADPSLELDKKKVVQKGQPGKLKVIREDLIIGDRIVSSKVLDRIVVKEPQDEIIHLGTKKVCKKAIVEGKEIFYWKKLRVWATSYDHTCYGCNHWTATGKYLTKGIIAVDPRVIDLHTTMYVPGYGFGQAEDTGGAIKGNHIDLGFEDLRKGTWSARWVDIYLIDHCMPDLKFNWRTKWD